MLQTVTLHGNKEQMLKFAFVLADESRDGQISRKELIRALERNVFIMKRALLRKAFTKDGKLDKFMYNTSSRRVTLTPDDKKKIKELAEGLIEIADTDKVCHPFIVLLSSKFLFNHHFSLHRMGRSVLTSSSKPPLRTQNCSNLSPTKYFCIISPPCCNNGTSS